MRTIYLGMALAVLGAQNATADLLVAKRESPVFETKGIAVIMYDATFTTGVEERDINIPRIVDVNDDARWIAVEPDRESGWTRCRLPLENKMSWQGIKNRSLVFECRRTSRRR